MTERDQIRHVCRWNRTLARENIQLREALRYRERECRRLRASNAGLGVQLVACDRMLGGAMDRATLTEVVVGLVALGAVGPALARLASALVPLVLLVGVVVAVLRAVWFYTR
jgi:hypothetical protein